MPHDYRYDPFNDVSEAVSITGETHVIPNNSPYTIRLKEVPKKDTPSSISLTIGGAAANEVSAAPAAGEFWPDYSTKADDDDSWNTGTILFNAADAGKTVIVSYTGTGTLVDTEKMCGLHGCDIFTSSDVWMCPEGIEHVNILLFGGGGGGAGKSGSTNKTGTDGGASSFGSLLTAGGGQRALIGTTAAKCGSISASLDTILLGLSPFYAGSPGASGAMTGGDGGDATGYGNSGGNANSGGGGASLNENGNAGSTSSAIGSSAGGGGLYAVGLPVTEKTSYNVVVGAGGTGGDGTNYDGGDGAPGICIIWY